MFDMESTSLRRSARLANKPKQQYGLFNTLSLTVIEVCGVDNNHHIFLTNSKQAYPGN